MKISIDIDDNYKDTEVVIRTPKLTQDVEKMIAVMRMLNMQIAVNKNGETYLLDSGKILYV
jgi:hypothetical protein